MQLTLTPYLSDGDPTGAIYLPMHGSAQGIWDGLKTRNIALVAVSGFDWNRDLSPWPAQAVFGNEDFGGQADAFLHALLGQIPEFEENARIKPLWRGIAGYSLAGLFAVYAAWRCDAFTRVASVSGSMWFDGWLSYALKTPLSAPLTHAYFSVGAKEKKTRNARMATVEDNTREMAALMRSRGVQSAFELNPGNHFADTDARMIRALAWLTK